VTVKQEIEAEKKKQLFLKKHYEERKWRKQREAEGIELNCNSLIFR
jgi:hypothetical protein